MKYIKFGYLVALALAGSVVAVQAGEGGFTGNIDLLVGQKALKSGDWEPAEKQTAFGIQADGKMSSWPISIAIGYTKTEGDGEDEVGDMFEGRTTELDLGIKYIFEKSETLKPFIGGGVTQIKGEVEYPLLNASASDTGTGYWLSGGLRFILAQHLNLGAQVKYASAKADFDTGEDAELGGTSLSVLLGYHF